jgi:hypothetical protein
VTLATLCLLSFHCSEEPPKLANGQIIYEFLEHTAGAQITTMNQNSVKFGDTFTINNQKRPVIFEHPNAEVIFTDVMIPKNAVLQVGIGIAPAVWDKSGDGVTFEITAVDEKSSRVLIFSRYIDPKNIPEDRKWVDTDVALDDFVGQKVSFVFTTGYGPRGNGDYDAAGWATPRIRLR